MPPFHEQHMSTFRPVAVAKQKFLPGDYQNHDARDPDRFFEAARPTGERIALGRDGHFYHHRGNRNEKATEELFEPGDRRCPGLALGLRLQPEATPSRIVRARSSTIPSIPGSPALTDTTAQETGRNSYKVTGLVNRTWTTRTTASTAGSSTARWRAGTSARSDFGFRQEDRSGRHGAGVLGLAISRYSGERRQGSRRQAERLRKGRDPRSTTWATWKGRNAPTKCVAIWIGTTVRSAIWIDVSAFERPHPDRQRPGVLRARPAGNCRSPAISDRRGGWATAIQLCGWRRR